MESMLFPIKVWEEPTTDAETKKEVTHQLTTNDDHTLWVSPEKKAKLIFEFEPSSASDVMVDAVGLRCWHAYKTNPAILHLEVSATTTACFVHWQTFYPDLKAGTQTFKLKRGIRASELRFARLKIAETHGGDKTYLNQVLWLTAYKVQTGLTTANQTVSQIFNRGPAAVNVGDDLSANGRHMQSLVSYNHEPQQPKQSSSKAKLVE